MLHTLSRDIFDSAVENLSIVQSPKKKIFSLASVGNLYKLLVSKELSAPCIPFLNPRKVGKVVE